MDMPLIRTGRGVYFDGVTSARHLVSIHLEPSALRIMGENDPIFVRWPYDELLQLSAPDGLLRLGRAGTKRLERLEVRDPDLAHAIDERAHPVDRSGTLERRSRVRVVGWTFAAVLTLVAAGIFGIPALADRVAPYVPVALERWVGDAVDAQVRSMLDTSGAGTAFECGGAPAEQAGRAALTKLVGKLEAPAQLPIPLHVVPIRRKEANAVALPGGRIYVYEGLIARAETPDELAAVIAHEIGHVAHRDGMRSVLQGAGISFLFGMLLGDFVGGGAVVLAAKTVLSSSYSREVERGADQYAVALMNRLGGDARALGTLLTRVSGGTHPGLKILLGHPDTRERVAAIDAISSPKGSATFLDAEEWAALKRICSGP